MARNPYAASLRAHKPRRIEDKREQDRIDWFWKVWDEIDAAPDSQQFSYPPDDA